MQYVNTVTFSVQTRSFCGIRFIWTGWPFASGRIFRNVLMNSLKPLNSLSVWVLGVINGILVGLIAEAVRVAYVNYEMSRAVSEFAHTGMSVDFVEARHGVLVPVICVVVFPIVGYLVHRYFINHQRTLLFLWLALGAIALWAGYFMSSSNPTALSFMWILSFAVVSYLVHRLWRKYGDLLFLLWLVNGVSAVLVVALGVQLVGLLFYWPELRSPLLWLLILLGIIATNLIYGAVVHLIFDRFSGRKTKQASA